LNAETQRIAIAEACGWKHEPDKYYEDRLAWFDPSTNGRCSTGDLPDYLNDLNAMHEAEKGLTTEDQQWKYVALLVGRDWTESWSFFDASKAIHATAAQRAEAFLKTLGFWK
jgi:hypothetical protein